MSDGSWYRLCVENKRRWSPAKDVRVLLLNFEQPNAAGQYRTTWIGEVPLVWSNQQVIPLTPTIGPPHECDLCGVFKQPSGRYTLSLCPLIQPFNLPSSWQEAVRFVLTLQARGVESGDGRHDPVSCQSVYEQIQEAGLHRLQRSLASP